MKLLDAHNHLHDARLAPFRTEVIADFQRVGGGGAVVNGTSENDWAAVETLAAEYAWVRPSFGLHPWFVGECSERWLAILREKLEAHPRAGVGEIGLDRWIKDHDLARQSAVFRAQLALAAELDRPATVHCVRAWGALDEILRDERRPARGFLLHAYAGPAEMIDGFAERGAYFSFNAYFLHERKTAQRAAFAQIPLERLLVETDAPDLSPPKERNDFPLFEDEDVINHPANLRLAYEALAELRGLPLEALAAQVEENFARLFG